MIDEITFKVSDRALGDALCSIHAARAFVRRVKGQAIYLQGKAKEYVVYVDDYEDVVRAYGDGLLRLGNRGRVIDLTSQAAALHRLKTPGICHNYLGTFMIQVGIPAEAGMHLELPYFPDPPIPEPYVALQPFSAFAQPNLSVVLIQHLIDQARSLGFKVLMVGKLSTPQKWINVDYSTLGSAAKFLRTIQHARGVLTPRSAAVHIAAGYKKKTLVWIPEDGENWHLNYDFPHTRVPIRNGPLLDEADRVLKTWQA